MFNNLATLCAAAEATHDTLAASLVHSSGLSTLHRMGHTVYTMIKLLAVVLATAQSASAALPGCGGRHTSAAIDASGVVPGDAHDGGAYVTVYAASAVMEGPQRRRIVMWRTYAHCTDHATTPTLPKRRFAGTYCATSCSSLELMPPCTSTTSSPMSGLPAAASSFQSSTFGAG